MDSIQLCANTAKLLTSELSENLQPFFKIKDGIILNKDFFTLKQNLNVACAITFC